MWPAFKPSSAMNSSPLPVAHSRPWTPPDTDSDIFPDPFQPDATLPDDCDNSSIPPQPNAHPKPTSSTTDPYYLAKASRLPDAHAHPIISPSSALIDPHTPTKAIKTPEPHAHNSIPSYPYTPDSARTTRAHGLPPLSPLPPMPWDSVTSSSPVQNALSSCIEHLESLITTRQPNEDQMEYLISKFEEMAQFLSAPEAQSRQSDDHLFSEWDIPSGLGISNVAGEDEQKTRDTAMGASFILDVGNYITSVKKHTEDLKMRMDEVKTLNSIQLEIIDDLRRELKHKEASHKSKREVAKTKPAPKESKRRPERKGFWVAVGEALDAVGEMLHEW